MEHAIRKEGLKFALEVDLEDFFGTTVAEKAKVLNLIIRSDVQGSFEAIKQALVALSNKEFNTALSRSLQICFS